MTRIDKIFYLIGWILYIFLAVAALLQHSGIFRLTDLPLSCSFRHVTGLYCPGCGITHAVMALANGRILQSFLYHPLVVYTALCFAVFLVWNSMAALPRFLRKNRNENACVQTKTIPYAHFHIAYVYIGIGIIFLQWFVKLYLLI